MGTLAPKATSPPRRAPIASLAHLSVDHAPIALTHAILGIFPRVDTLSLQCWRGAAQVHADMVASRHQVRALRVAGPAGVLAPSLAAMLDPAALSRLHLTQPPGREAPWDAAAAASTNILLGAVGHGLVHFEFACYSGCFWDNRAFNARSCAHRSARGVCLYVLTIRCRRFCSAVALHEPPLGHLRRAHPERTAIHSVDQGHARPVPSSRASAVRHARARAED